MSKTYRRDDFSGQLNTKFQIHFTPDMVMEGELIAVSEISESGPYESFTITFLIPEACPIHQQIYPIDHPQMDKMELFLVPSGKGEKGTTFVSTFSYSKE